MSSSTASKARAGIVLEGKYLLERELGAGGMGQVFLARHQTLERDVAIKVLHPNLADDDSVRRRFETEAKAIARLRHPGCVMLYEFGYSNEIEALFAVFEYVEGRSLEAFIGTQLPVADVVALGRQVALGIAHAHDQNIIHRDLKPENIMVVDGDDDDKPVEIKVLDFGIARIAEDDEKRTRLTQMGQMFGTPPYMSPEQVRAKLDVTYSTDIYSIGVILYEMIEGRLPFLGDTPIETVMLHLNEDVPPMTRDEVPGALQNIVMRCLEKDGDARFASCRELAAALEEIDVEAGEGSLLGASVEPNEEAEASGQAKKGESASDSGNGGDTEEGGVDGDSDEALAQANTMLAYDTDSHDAAVSEGDGVDADVEADADADANADAEAASVARAAKPAATTDDLGTNGQVTTYELGFDDGQRKKLIMALVVMIALLSFAGIALVMVLSEDDQNLREELPADESTTASGDQIGAGGQEESDGEEGQQQEFDRALADDEAPEDEPEMVAEESGGDVAGDEADDTDDEADQADEAAENSQDQPSPAIADEEPPPRQPTNPPQEQNPPAEEPGSDDTDSERAEPSALSLGERRRRAEEDDEEDEGDSSSEEESSEPTGLELPTRD